MTQVAPASRSIGAEISPVCAPLGFAWQSCPPTITADPASMRATVKISVAGGQTSTSQPSPSPPRRSRASAASGATICAAVSVSPFIFQLPAIRGVISFQLSVAGHCLTPDRLI